MNVTSALSTLAPLPTASPQAMPPAGSPDQDSGDRKAGRAHHGHGGGHMHDAVAQALQSLGLTLPASGTAPTTATSPASTDSTDPTGAGGSSDVKNDLRQFMHQLFEAVKGEGAASSSSGSSGAASSADPQSGFAAGLSALITQVSGGTAPDALQSAFAKLSTDLSSGAGASTSGGAGSSQATLQAFLTNLQQDLGYGSAASTTAAGSLMTTQA